MGSLANLEGNEVWSRICSSLNYNCLAFVFTEEIMKDKLSEVINVVNEDCGCMFSSVNITAEDINQRIIKLITNKAPKC